MQLIEAEVLLWMSAYKHPGRDAEGRVIAEQSLKRLS